MRHKLVSHAFEIKRHEAKVLCASIEVHLSQRRSGVPDSKIALLANRQAAESISKALQESNLKSTEKVVVNVVDLMVARKVLRDVIDAPLSEGYAFPRDEFAEVDESLRGLFAERLR